MENEGPDYDYCTPEFHGFQTDVPDGADAIFQGLRIKEERSSIVPEDPEELPNFDDLIASVTIKKEPAMNQPLRRSISANHILDVRDVQMAMDQMKINGKCNVGSKRQKSVENIHMHSRENLYVKKENCDTTISNEKFVSMAERIYHMQNDTPKRFRSTMSRPDPKMVQAAMNRKRAQLVSRSTIPQSPALLSKTRIRPVTALSQQQLEEKEVEEIKKFHLKANPVPKRVLNGTHLAPVQRRPPTKFEAFNITEMKKKALPSAVEEFKFTAKPAPTTILERPVGIGKKIEFPVTLPITPRFMKARSFENGGNSNTDEGNRLKSSRSDKSNVSDCGSSMSTVSLRKFMEPLKPMPFSFEQRDRLMLERKQEKINAIYEEEKRAREFKAQPVPAIIRRKLIVQSPKKQLENKENVCKPIIKFEAKPPLVLYKEPFKPVKLESPLMTMCPFNLTSHKRAAQREMFDQKIRELEMVKEERRKEEDQERLQAEQREIAMLRSQLVHQANPIRYYPAVKVIKNATLTFPESPQFQFKRKQQRLLLQSRNAEMQLNQDTTDAPKVEIMSTEMKKD